MKNLQWTTERPVEDGWYWLNDPARYGEEPVRVKGGLCFRNGVTEPDIIANFELQGWEFLGPITPDDFLK